MSLRGTLVALSLAAAATPAVAQEFRRPLLEAGVFGGGGLIPDYPAADRSRPRPLLLPWVVYRGDLIQSDERGLRGRLYRESDLELTLNASGALAARSSGGVREGMPDLDYLGEIGPSLRWTPWRSADRTTRVTLDLPVRAVFGTDLSRIRHRGFVFAPEIALERARIFGAEDRVRVGVGPVFATGPLMDHWYRVRPEEARPGRPAYQAEGGYLGTRLQFSYRTPLTSRLWLTAGGRLENFTGARNEDSPLFRSEWNATLVGGVSLTLFQSGATVAGAVEPLD